MSIFNKILCPMEFINFETFRSIEGKSFAPTAWLKVTQEMINHFANATHDFQWIHVDEIRAKKESPFKKTIAHGFLSLALLPKFLSNAVQVKSLKMGYNYGLEHVRFPHAVAVGSNVRGLITVDKITPQKFNGLKIIWNVIVEIEGIKKPACSAKMITLAYE